MKRIKNIAATFTLVFMSMLLSLFAWAQDKGAEIDVNVNKGGGGSNWYTQPWVWVIGAAIFILLLVALLRGNSSKD
jgi:hypothetical protein